MFFLLSSLIGEVKLLNSAHYDEVHHTKDKRGA